MVAVGLAGLSFSIGVAFWTAKLLKAQDRPTTVAWRHLSLSPIAWISVIAIVGTVNAAAGGVLMLLAFLGALVQIFRGVRDFPRVWRLIGDADAWRGRNPQ